MVIGGFGIPQRRGIQVFLIFEVWSLCIFVVVETKKEDEKEEQG